MVNNINIDSKGRYQYYKIDKLLKCTEFELVLNVHDFQTRIFVPVKIVCENTELYLVMEDGTKSRLVGISKDFRSTSFYLCGHPVVETNSGGFDFMANRMCGVENLGDLYDCYQDANGKVQKKVYLDSWLITDTLVDDENISLRGKTESE